MAKGPNVNRGNENTDHWVLNEVSPKRIRVMFNGEAVADSTQALLMMEAWHRPAYYFPQSDVRMDLMRRTDESTH